jgi:hypothetical protein
MARVAIKKPFPHALQPDELRAVEEFKTEFVGVIERLVPSLLEN